MSMIDDRRAKRIAEVNQINCVGTLGILLLAKHNGLVTEVAPFLNQLRHSPLHYTGALLSKVQKLAGES